MLRMLVDRLKAIYMDDDAVWTGELTRSGDYVDVTIEGRGTMRLYWGTETQTADSHLATAPNETHGAYRGICYAVFHDLYFGEDRTASPQIEFLVDRYPAPEWLTGGSEIGDTATINPVAVLWELWTHRRFGLGLPESRLDADSLTAAADMLATEGLGVAPVLDRGRSMRQMLGQLLEHVDGFPLVNTQGKLGLGLKRTASGTPPTLGINDLTSEPEIEPVGWAQTYNEMRVTYTNAARDFKTDAVKYHDRGNYQIMGGLRSQTLARPWFITSAVAQQVANAAGRAAALPQAKGKFSARRSRVASLGVGSVFVLDYPLSGISGLRCRVTSLTLQMDRPQVDVAFEEDLSFTNANLFTPSAVPDPVDNVQAVADLGYRSIMEAPYGLAVAEGCTALFLAVRGDTISTGFNVHKEMPSTSYDWQTAFYRFALRGHFAAAYGKTIIIDDTLGPEIILDGLDTLFDDEVSEDDGLRNKWLAFTAAGEIMSLYHPQVISAGRYRFWAVRGRYDTVRQAHALNDAVFLMRRADRNLLPLPYSASATHWKLQPFMGTAEYDLSLISPASLTLISRAFRPLAPLNVRVFHDGQQPYYTTGQDIVGQYDSPSALRGVEGAVDSAAFGAIETHVVVEIRTLANALQGTFILPANEPREWTITNAALVAALGSETGFVARVYLERSGWRSLHFDEIKVLKA